MERLCEQTLAELRTDLEVHRSGVLPSCVDLAVEAAREYCDGLSGRLLVALQACPPQYPSPGMIRLSQAACRLQVLLQLLSQTTSPPTHLSLR
jgi:hypothetical protein